MVESFGDRLKELRKSAGVTQSKLAETLGVHLQTVSKWERGVCEPDLSVLGEIASALGVTLEKLLGQKEGESTYAGAFDAAELGKALAAALSSGFVLFVRSGVRLASAPASAASG